MPRIVQEALKHGKMYESKARDMYTNYLKHTLQHDIDVRETGIVIQPNLFWLAASPDGLISDKSDGQKIGLIEIKCPRSKKYDTPEEMLNDKNFYMHLVDGEPRLKMDHANGYYTQIQMAMGLSGLSFCDFIVYSFKGLILSRTRFDGPYFIELIKRLNKFYKIYMLPEIS